MTDGWRSLAEAYERLSEDDRARFREAAGLVAERLCSCGCGEPVPVESRYASGACRVRAFRRRRAAGAGEPGAVPCARCKIEAGRSAMRYDQVWGVICRDEAACDQRLLDEQILLRKQRWSRSAAVGRRRRSLPG